MPLMGHPISAVFYGKICYCNVACCDFMTFPWATAVDNCCFFVFSDKGNCFVYNYVFVVSFVSDEYCVSFVCVVYCFLNC